MPELSKLICYTIYDSPSDYPGVHVVRKWVADPAGPQDGGVHAVTGTLAEARRSIPNGYAVMPRDPSDPPSIVEMWL
jgi:hypothetical protein